MVRKTTLRMVKLAASLAAVAPVAALGLLAFFWGNFPGAATAEGATAAQLILLLLLAAGGAGWRRRPMGRGESAALILLWLAALVATASSEVPRAGRCALALLPVFGILPRLAAHLFAAGGSLRLAARSLAALLAAAAAWGLWGTLFGGTPGASLPLGHHNLLAVFLLMLLPAPLALAFEGEGRERWLAGAAAGLGVAALLATRSLGGGLALGALLLLFFGREQWVARRKPLAVGLALGAGLLLLALAPRLLAGGDLGLSVAARWSYLAGGLRGFAEAPFVGHGPGSTPWLFAEYFAPRVAIHPPEHLVADLHNLPLQVLFELGLFGAFAAAWWLFTLLWPLWAAPAPADPFRAALLRAARAGLAAALVFSTTGFLLAVPALPFAFVLLVGLARAALPPAIPAALEPAPAVPDVLPALLPAEPAPVEHAPLASRREAWLVSVALGLLAVALFFWLLPGLRAQGAWERARTADDSSEARWALEEAVALDPRFPLYRARLGLAAEIPAQLEQAQKDAGAVGPLTLQAALEAEADALPQAAELLARACDLDPFGALAPFRLAVGKAGGDSDLRVERAMRALVAEPRLAAVAAWRVHPEILQRAQVRLDGEGPPGWSAALLPSLAKGLGPAPGPTADLVLTIDADPAESVSLVVFRRSPWSAPLARVAVHAEALPAEVGPAVNEKGMRRDFVAPSCRWRPPG